MSSSVAMDSRETPVTYIIRVSLCSGLFPDDFKHARVSPILKKTYMPTKSQNSYRPISDLSFISKVFVANRLRSHIYINDLSDVPQSAYKQFHPT